MSMKLVVLFWMSIYSSIAWSADWSMDWSYNHTQATKALPEYSPGKDGLVRVGARGLEFRARVYGQGNSGEGVILLHGFPGSSIMWDGLAQSLASRGFRVLAYDQRGYSPGARPSGKSNYVINHFLNDLSALAKKVGFNRFHLVGHDVGCVVGWGAAMAFPQLLKTLSCLSIPNPEVLELRSYVKLLSVPVLPEMWLRNGHSKKFQSLLPDGRSQLEDEEYRQIFTEPGAITATLNFYRGIYRSKRLLTDQLSRKIEVPTLFIYGIGEGWVDLDTLVRQRETMADGVPLRVLEIPNAGKTGHFLIENQPERVIRAIHQHISN